MDNVKTFNADPKRLLRKAAAKGPIAHVGSLINKDDATQAEVDRMRSKWSWFGDEYVGIDLFAGLNVEVQADLTDADLFAKHPDLEGHFGIVICSALLEHVRDPFAAARNISRLLRPGGHLYFAGPWVWGYHPYPSDFWRISFEGLQVLFPDVEFKDWWYGGTRKNVGMRLKDASGERKAFRLDNPDGIVADRAMSYLNVCALGVKKAD